MGGRQAERVRDCHSRGRREFLYQREGWTSPLRGFLAARIFLLHRKKVSGFTGARQPRHFRSLHGRLRRVATRLPPSDRKSTRLNSSHLGISYAVFCLKKKKI